MPNPALVSGTQNNAAIASGTSATVTSTGSVTAGNFLVVFLLVGGATAPSALTAPDATWRTAMATIATASGGTIVAAIFTKQLTVTGAFSGAFSWTTTATSGHWALTEWSTPLGTLSVLDGTVVSTQNASGTNTSPSATPGASNTLDTLICCSFGGVVGVDTLTIPAGMTAISSMATSGTASVPFFFGASLALASSAATGAKTWTIPTSRTNLGVSLLLQTQVLWGWEPVSVIHKSRPKVLPKGRSEFAIFTPPFQEGWQVQPWQPPHPRWKKSGAVATGDTGTEAPLPLARVTFGQDPLVYRRRPERAGAVMRGDDGTQTATPIYEPLGFEEVTSQELHFPRARLSGALQRGIDSIESPYVNWIEVGFEETTSQDRHPRPERSGVIARGHDGIEFPTTRPQPWFESPIQIVVLHPRREKWVERGDEGIAVPTPVYEPLGFEQIFTQPPHRWFRSPEFGHAGIESPFVNWIKLGFEQVASQDIHTRRERLAALARGDEGIQAILPPPPVPWFEVHPVLPPHLRREKWATLERGDEGIAIPTPVYEVLGFDPTFSQDRHPPLLHRLAAILRGDDGIEGPLPPPPVPWFEVTPPFLAHPRPERNGAIARWIDGTPPFVFWQNVGFEQILSQDRHRLFKSPEFGHQGIDSPFVAFVPDGWTPTISQDQRFRRECSAALARGDDGIEPVFRAYQPWGETTPALVRKALFRAPEFGDPGIVAPFAPFTALAWPEPPVYRQPPTWRAGAVMAGDPGNYVPSAIVLPFASWPEPPMHQRPTYWRGGAIFRGDDGIAAVLPPFVFVATQWWDDRQPQEQLRIPPTRRFAGTVGGDPGTEAALINFFPYGWEVPPPPPPHPHRERSAGLVGGDGGFEAPAVPFFPYGWEVLPAGFSRRLRGLLPAVELIVPPAAAPPFVEQVASQQPRWVRRSPEFGDPGIASPFAPFTALEWPSPPTYRHPVPERRSGAILRGDDGIENTFTPPIAVATQWWDDRMEQLRVPPIRYGATLFGGDPGNQATLIQFFPHGWPVQPPPPPRPRPERSGAVQIGDPGIASPFAAFAPLFETSPPLLFHRIFRTPEFGERIQSRLVVPFPEGWHVQPPQPPHPRPERAGSIQFGDTGTQNVTAVAPFVNWGFEIAPPQPPHVKFEKAGAIQVGEPGIEAPSILFRAYGWEVQPVQPPHPAPEKRGAIVKGDEGVELFFILNLVLPNVAWPEPPMHKQPSQWRAAATMRGPDSIEAPQIIFRPYGWEIQPPQPPHRRPERAGAIALGEPGIEAAFIFIAPPQLGWAVQPWQPPHRWVERAGAIVKGDEGTLRPFTRFFPVGWEPTLPSPLVRPPTVFRRAAATMRGDDGTQRPFTRFFTYGFEPTPPLFFRRPLSHVPVFVLQSVESYAPFVSGVVASASTLIVPYRAAVTLGAMELSTLIVPYRGATTLGAMELKTIIEAFKAATVIKRRDT